MMSGFKGRGVEGSIMTPKNWTLEAKFRTLIGMSKMTPKNRTSFMYVPLPVVNSGHFWHWSSQLAYNMFSKHGTSFLK